MEDKLAVESHGHGITGDIIFGRAETAGQDDDFRIGQSAAHGMREPLAVVAHYIFSRYLDAQAIQLVGEEK